MGPERLNRVNSFVTGGRTLSSSLFFIREEESFSPPASAISLGQQLQTFWRVYDN